MDGRGEWRRRWCVGGGGRWKEGGLKYYNFSMESGMTFLNVAIATRNVELERYTQQRQEITPTKFDELGQLLVTVNALLRNQTGPTFLSHFSFSFNPRNKSETLKTCNETARSDNQTSLNYTI